MAVASVAPLRAGKDTVPDKLAGAIANEIRRNGSIDVEAMASGAVYKMVKAIAIARRYLAPAGVELACTPALLDVEDDTGRKLVVRFLLVGVPRSMPSSES